jgi:DICT domain-containing protein
MHTESLRLRAAPLLLTCLLAAGPALAAGSEDATRSTRNATVATADQSDAQGLVNEAVKVVQQM